MATAIVYSRVSTLNQAREELPIDGQVEKCLQRAAELNATVVARFTDAASGQTANRKGFQQAIEFCENHKVDFFITWDSSRFARNVADSINYEIRLNQAGTKIVYVSMPVDSDTDMGYLANVMKAAVDEMLVRATSNATKRSLVRNAEQGFSNGGQPPFGFKKIPDPVNPKRKRLAPEWTEVLVVQEIFERRVAGIGAKTIAQVLNSEGKYNRGRSWSRSAVLHILRNPAAVGQTLYNRKDRKKGVKPRDQWIVVQSHEPIIPIEVWNIVQRLMDDIVSNEQGGRISGKYLLTGFLRCGQCGATMCAETAGGRSKVYVYYLCRTKAVSGASHCSQRRISQPLADQLVIENLVNSVVTPAYFHEIVARHWQVNETEIQKKSSKIKQLKSEIDSLRIANDNLLKVIESGQAAGTSYDVLLSRISENRVKMKSLEDELAVMDAAKFVSPSAFSDEEILWRTEQLKKFILESDVPRLRVWLGLFVEKIVVVDESLEVIYHENSLFNSVCCGVVRDVQGQNRDMLLGVVTRGKIMVLLDC